MAYQPMIYPNSGEVDTLAIAQRAPLRAAAEYGSPNYPPSYLRDATAWLTLRAQAERREWRRDHRLLDDTGFVVMNVPEWGSSGDSFAR
ncbi:hypothetical protein [Bradyrhizobium sp.]